MEKQLLILDRDETYAYRLMDYINHKKGCGFHAVAFTDAGKLLEFIQKNTADILLLEEQFEETMKDHIAKMTAFILCEEKMEVDSLHKSIFKYQSAEELIKKVSMAVYPERELIFDPNQKKEMRIIGIGCLTWSEGAVKLSLEMAKESAVENKVLLIGLHPFLYPVTEQQGNLSRLFYQLKQEEEVTRESIKEFVYHEEGIDYLTGYSYFTDAVDFAEEEVDKLFAFLKESGEYEVILVEVGGFYPATAAIIEQCTQVCLVQQEEDRTMEGYNELLRQLTFAGQEEVSKKITLEYISNSRIHELALQLLAGEVAP